MTNKGQIHNSNKTNNLILNLTPENVTQHSRIVTMLASFAKVQHSDTDIVICENRKLFKEKIEFKCYALTGQSLRHE